MPWKECHVMDERLRFVARRLEGESMSALCAEFGIAARPATRSLSALGRLACRVERPQRLTSSMSSLVFPSIVTGMPSD